MAIPTHKTYIYFEARNKKGELLESRRYFKPIHFSTKLEYDEIIDKVEVMLQKEDKDYGVSVG